MDCADGRWYSETYHGGSVPPHRSPPAEKTKKEERQLEGKHPTLKKLASVCVAAISGSFVQRGGPAIYDKYLRTRMALTCGADLVVELPSLFATLMLRSSALHTS